MAAEKEEKSIKTPDSIRPAYKDSEIAQIINGKRITTFQRKSITSTILIDSRNTILNPPTTLFFALIGERQNGHHYISELYNKGVRNFVVSEEPKELEKFRDVSIIMVENTLTALQQLVAFHRNQFDVPVIGITGSNGKTIVKEWLFQLLFQDKNIVRSPRSYNSQVGVPLSVWQLNADHELALFEAGISKKGEMERLEAIIKPTIGIITNIGEAHSENFKGMAPKVDEKLRLFYNAKVLFYCKDHAIIEERINVEKKFKAVKKFCWSRQAEADLKITDVVRRHRKTDIQGIYCHKVISIQIPFSDDASIENAIHCWAVLLYFGNPNDRVQSRMDQLAPVAMRLELLEGVNNTTVINDSYNSDITSLNIALDFLSHQNQHDKKTVILSDILQSGVSEDVLYKTVSEMLQKKKISRFIGIGEGIGKQRDHFHVPDAVFFPSTQEFLNNLGNIRFSREVVLLKGARHFGFERIGKALQRKVHETVLEINLMAMIHNLNFFRSKLAPSTKLMVMVKAFSYGSGSFEIASLLQYHRVEYLGVAYADEGIELRKSGITVPIMVMNPQQDSFAAILKYQLEPELYSLRSLHTFLAALKTSITTTNSPFPVHIKLDTGMHRLGFEEKEIDQLIKELNENQNIRVQSIFSHLAAADDPEQDEFTHRQIKSFSQLSSRVLKHLNYPVMRHILNSPGILRFPQAQFEMVRLGIGLYGITAIQKEQQHLEQVSALKTTISQIKTIPKGETVGYSRRGVATADLTLAIVPIGYADGYSRKLGNGKGKMLINGALAPTVGDICMDMTMLDITGISVKEGDQVLVFGKNYPVTNLAKNSGTIPYEVLTGISGRVKRVYHQE